MGYGPLKENLRGVAFTIPTPFTADGEKVDHEALAAHVEYLRDAGARAIIPCGNTGEYYSLSNSERVAVVETTVEAMDGQGAVVAGAGGSTKNTIQLIRQYEEAGADAVMVMYPVHTYLHETGVRRYYEEIAAATDLGVVLYKRGERLSASVIKALSTIENVVAAKYAVNDIKSFTAAVENTPGEIVFTNGIAERFAISFASEGAEGITTGIGNFVPEATLELMNELRNGNYDRARKWRNLLWPIEELRDETGRNNHMSAANNVPVVKYGLELAGLYGGPVREPLVDLSDTDRKRLENYYEAIRSEL